LIEHGLNPDDSRINGQIPLHYAAYKGYYETVVSLVQAGANLNMEYKSMTPLKRATSGGRREVQDYLISIGALDI
jgi:ankyrin repeat protein